MHIKLLTYNIHKAIGVDRKFAPERIIEILEHYDPDIALLQEVDRHVPRSQNTDLASLIGNAIRLHYRAVGMNVYLKKGRYGNATLSRWPIGRQENINLTISWRKRRGAQHTRIVTPQKRPQEIDVYNVHLGLSALERKKQVRKLLRDRVLREHDESRPCIIAGDMNDWRGLLRKFFVAHGFECATNRSEGLKTAIRTFPSYAPTGGLDKVFFYGPLKLIRAYRSRLKLARIASDHLPVIVEFELPPAAKTH